MATLSQRKGASGFIWIQIKDMLNKVPNNENNKTLGNKNYK